jgi:hypothetical protein
MFPKRGQVWTYRERTRFLAFTRSNGQEELGAR